MSYFTNDQMIIVGFVFSAHSGIQRVYIEANNESNKNTNVMLQLNIDKKLCVLTLIAFVPCLLTCLLTPHLYVINMLNF